MTTAGPGSRKAGEGVRVTICLKCSLYIRVSGRIRDLPIQLVAGGGLCCVASGTRLAKGFTAGGAGPKGFTTGAVGSASKTSESEAGVSGVSSASSLVEERCPAANLQLMEFRWAQVVTACRFHRWFPRAHPSHLGSPRSCFRWSHGHWLIAKGLQYLRRIEDCLARG